MDAPELLGSDGADNLVAWDGRVWRVPRILGPTRLDDDHERSRPGITSHASLEEAAAHRPITPAIATQGRIIRCTWWERTDRMSDYIDGISSPIYRSIDTGEESTLRDVPGALFVTERDAGADPNAHPRAGSDGLSVVCVLPGPHHWYIDGRASNCTLPDDKVHRCWVRHGTVGERITVDKNGFTCQAGGGSIAVPGFHAMLQNGELREC